MVGKFGENVGVYIYKGLLSLLPLPIEYIFITYTNPNVFDFYFLIGKTVGKYGHKAGGSNFRKQWPLLSAVSITEMRETKPTSGRLIVTHKQQIQWTNRAACFIAGLFGFVFLELIELIAGAN